MTDFPAIMISSDEKNVTPVSFANRVAAAYKQAPARVRSVVNDPPALSTTVTSANTLTSGAPAAPASVDWKAKVEDKSGEGFDWFEDFHVIPRSFLLGNVLSSQTIAVEVFSAFRDSVHYWLDFLNNAGSGVVLSGAPSLPYAFPPLTGKVMSLQIDTVGEPSVDTTLDFVFDIGTIHVPIQLDRVVLFSLPPEMPYTEILQFLTDIKEHTDGSEQRAALRKNPRQFFEWEVMMEPGVERQIIDALMFEWQTRSFGIPIWKEMAFITVAASIGATTIAVDSTDFADYRIGELVLLYSSQTKFDVLELLSKTTTSLTFVNATQNAYSVNSLAMPLRIGVLDTKPQASRFPTDAQRLRMKFRIKDNDANLASTAAFATFNSKVLLDGLNGIMTALEESFDQRLIVNDNGTGVTEESSPWAHQRHESVKTFLAKGKQKTWEVRQLLHALRGRQVSFYLPTFGRDVELLNPTASGSLLMDIKNIGYTKYVRSRQPKNVIRITFKDGSTPLLRTIVSSTESDATKEVLTLNATWPAIYTPAQIDRVMYVEKGRFDSDSIVFQHMLGERVTKIIAPFKAVNE